MNRILRLILSVLLGGVLLASCSAQNRPVAPAPQDRGSYAPRPGDTEMLQGEAQIDSADIALAESYPPQVMVHFAYFLPTPCYQLRVGVARPDSQNRIQVRAYGVAEKDKPCTRMAITTPLQATLNLGSFPTGHYSVWLNNVKVGEFDS